MPWSLLIPPKHTHINTRDPTSTQTTHAHTAAIQQEVAKATCAPPTLASSWQGHPSSLLDLLKEHVEHTQGSRCHSWTLHSSLTTVVLSLPHV